MLLERAVPADRFVSVASTRTCGLARDAITASELQKVDAFAFPIDATPYL